MMKWEWESEPTNQSIKIDFMLCFPFSFRFLKLWCIWMAFRIVLVLLGLSGWCFQSLRSPLPSRRMLAPFRSVSLETSDLLHLACCGAVVGVSVPGPTRHQQSGVLISINRWEQFSSEDKYGGAGRAVYQLSKGFSFKQKNATFILRRAFTCYICQTHSS